MIIIRLCLIIVGHCLCSSYREPVPPAGCSSSYGCCHVRRQGLCLMKVRDGYYKCIVQDWSKRTRVRKIGRGLGKSETL
ncbi:hypothetical protein F4808DRAFT_419694 [Astrocystis sublimbata]|nr:hypothetical protein F4808DRAFT_419694 [Astrocystis sublimbata]